MLRIYLYPPSLAQGMLDPRWICIFLYLLLTTSHMDPEKWRLQIHYSICKAYYLCELYMQETMIILAKMLLTMGILLPWLPPTKGNVHVCIEIRSL